MEGSEIRQGGGAPHGDLRLYICRSPGGPAGPAAQHLPGGQDIEAPVRAYRRDRQHGRWQLRQPGRHKRRKGDRGTGGRFQHPVERPGAKRGTPKEHGGGHRPRAQEPPCHHSRPARGARGRGHRGGQERGRLPDGGHPAAHPPGGGPPAAVHRGGGPAQARPGTGRTGGDGEGGRLPV